MNFASPKRISISNIRSNSKNKELGSPNKPTPKDEQVNINNLLLPPADNHQTPSKRLMRRISNDSYRQSVTKSQASQNGSDQPKKTKNLMIDYLQQMVKDLRTNISQAENVKYIVTLKNLHSIQEFNSFAQQFFKAYNYYHGISLQKEQNKQIIIPLRYKQAKKVLFAQEASNAELKATKNKKIIDLTKQNEDLKKELSKCRQSIKELQKRLVFLIEQFKARKSVYLKEIEKLVSIIETSIKGIPDLITLNKQLIAAKSASDNQLPLPNMDPKLAKRETQYNTLFYNYSNQGSIEPSSIQRYKSEGKIRIKQ